MTSPSGFPGATRAISRFVPHTIKHRIKKYRDLLLRKPQDLSLHAFSQTEHPLDESDPISVQFHERRPWFTEFEIGDARYGGTNSYRGCRRILDFFDWANPQGRVLELGSFEGMHSMMLAENPNIAEVLGLEGRQFLIDKAQFIKELFSLQKVEFRCCDFEVGTLRKFGRFDAVFCSGVLYHMTHPWRFIEMMCEVSDCVFIGSHIADQAVEVRDGFAGRTCAEFGYHEPLSGMNTYSYWLTHEALVEAFRRQGFQLVQNRIVPEWPNGTWENALFTRTK